MEKSIRQDILDKLFVASQEHGKRVVATLIIDGGDVGNVEASFLVDRRIMTRLTDLPDNIREDQLRTG
jgi:hypothetical protein